MEAEEEIPEILRIPRPLQEAYFELAKKEAERILSELSVVSEPIRRAFELLVPLLRSRADGAERPEWRDKVFAVVDGSDTPSIDERIGLRLGLVAACRKDFRGIEQIPGAEWFVGDVLRGTHHTSREDFAKTLDLVTTYLERLYAVKALEDKRVDYVVIDGSFWGFRAGCSRVKHLELNWTDPVTQKTFRETHQLIDELVRMTEKLLQSGRAFGVVKRVATSAIDGYVAHRTGNAELTTGLTDRSILTLAMEVGQVLDMSELLGPENPPEVLSALSGMIHERRRRGKEVNVNELYKESWRRVSNQIVTDLLHRGTDEPEERKARILETVLSTKRVFLRTVPDQPPVCIEFPKGVDAETVELAVTYAFETANPATGLPLALDLVDELISLPRGIGREFVEEVEGILLSRGLDLSRMRAVFSKINPQKEFE